MTKIVYQGEPGSNSHIACAENYPDFESVACATFEDCFAAVEEGSAELAMIPLENSIAGRVADIHHILPHSSLKIIAETFLKIRFDLMALTGATLSTLKTAESHIMALGQCRKTMRELNLKPVTTLDTAGAAKAISETQDISRAALAPPLAAKIYGLNILKENCQDATHNTTRFIILSKKASAPDCQNGCITTFLFRARNLPAALYKALGGFATNGINMTKIESYMVDGEFSAAMFYCDVEGHPEDIRLKNAFEELQFFSKEFRVLGTYAAHPFRRKS